MRARQSVGMKRMHELRTRRLTCKGLRHSRKVPVIVRIAKSPAQHSRDENLGVVQVGGSRFEDEDVLVSILGEPIGYSQTPNAAA